MYVSIHVHGVHDVLYCSIHKFYTFLGISILGISNILNFNINFIVRYIPLQIHKHFVLVQIIFIIK